MIADPRARGAALARLYAEVEPRLWADLVGSGIAGDTAAARREWECFALYACVRGLVAAGGMNRETAFAIEALHEAVLARWRAEPEAGERFDLRRARVAERYAEYGTIGQDGGAAGAETVAARLGAAWALHAAGPAAGPELAELAGHLHESLAEAAAEAVREAS